MIFLLKKRKGKYAEVKDLAPGLRWKVNDYSQRLQNRLTRRSLPGTRL